MMIFVLYFIVGTIFASFACCLGYRLGKSQPPWSPSRSYCDCCGHPLCTWQLIPLLGWLWQAGRCHYCHERISAFLPLTEVIIGSSTLLLCCHQPWFIQLIYLTSLTTLTLLASCDYFNRFIYPVSLVGLFPLLLIYHPSWTFTDLLLSFFLLIVLFIFTSVNHSLGIGDLEFLIVALITLGIYPTLTIILLASIITLFLSPFFRYRLPFIPGLALAMICTLVYLK